MVCRAAGQASTMLNVASHVAWLALIGRLEKSQCDGGHKMCVLPKRDGAQQHSSGFLHKQRSSIVNSYETRLQDLDVSLPELPKPIANYIPAKRVAAL